MNMIIMPVLAHRTMTEQALASCLLQDIDGGENLCVHVIDNGSRDGCGPWLRSLNPPVYLSTYPATRSLNKVWNYALDLAFYGLKVDYVLVVNNDVILRTDTYRLLRDDGGLFVTGVSVSTMAETEQADPKSKSPHPSFSCFLIRRECWEKVGKFDEDYWVYCSDGDYHLRMDAAGIEAYALAVPFFHEVSGTLKYASNDLRDKIQLQADEDRATFRHKYGFAIGSPEYYQQFKTSRENKYLATGRL